MSETQSLSEFLPKLNPWFSESGEYTGPAEFQVDGGSVIRGQGRISWDATGECRIMVEIDPASVVLVAQIATSDHRLGKFRLTASDGIFEAAQVLIANTHMNMGQA